MERYDLITQAIYDAIGEINESLEPDEALSAAPETVLIGETGTLDSVSFVMFALSVEQNVESITGGSISVMDVIEPVESSPLTVRVLAGRIAKLVDCVAQE